MPDTACGTAAALAALLRTVVAADRSRAVDQHLGDAIVACLHTMLAETRSAALGERSEVLVGELMAWLDSRHANKTLSPETLAAHHFLSARYIRKIFAGYGTTVTAYLRQRRLERIRDELLQPGNAHVPVSVPAARWAYAEPSVFSRAFTRQFGQSPQRFRPTSRRQDRVR